MGKDYIETIPRQVKDAELASDSIDHTAISDSFIKLDSSDPAVGNDTGEGYVVGSLWINTTSGSQFIAIDVSAESSVWANQEGDDINNDPFNGSNYGFSIGGYGPSGGGDLKDVMDRFALSSPHAMTDFGEINTAGYAKQVFTGSGQTVGFTAGGNSPPGSRPAEVSNFPFTSPGAATDLGDLMNTAVAGATIQCQTPSLGIIGGGSGPGRIDLIQTISTVSPYAGADSGAELVVAADYSSNSQSPTHGYAGGGSTPSGMTGNITRYQKATTDNSADVGELGSFGPPQSGASAGGATDGRGGFGFHISGQGISPSAEISTIQKFPFASPTSGIDMGEFTTPTGPAGRNMPGSGCASSLTHFFQLDYTDNLWKGAFASPSTTVDVAEPTTAHANSVMTQY